MEKTASQDTEVVTQSDQLLCGYVSIADARRLMGSDILEYYDASKKTLSLPVPILVCDALVELMNGERVPEKLVSGFLSQVKSRDTARLSKLLYTDEASVYKYFNSRQAMSAFYLDVDVVTTQKKFTTPDDVTQLLVLGQELEYRRWSSSAVEEAAFGNSGLRAPTPYSYYNSQRALMWYYRRNPLELPFETLLLCAREAVEETMTPGLITTLCCYTGERVAIKSSRVLFSRYSSVVTDGGVELLSPPSLSTTQLYINFMSAVLPEDVDEYDNNELLMILSLLGLGELINGELNIPVNDATNTSAYELIKRVNRLVLDNSGRDVDALAELMGEDLLMRLGVAVMAYYLNPSNVKPSPSALQFAEAVESYFG